MLQAMRTFLGQNDMMAYLTMMAPRMVELHRVLKPTGSIYLHCDPTARPEPVEGPSSPHSGESRNPSGLSF